jgi:carboxymethylenebutenolidase
MGEIVRIPSPGIPLVYGEPGNPVAVLIHDWYGRLPWLEPYAQALASRAGLRVVVPDLYDGDATVDADEAEKLAARVLGDRAATDRALRLVADAIAQGRGEGAYRAGLVGFSLGGFVALLAAQQGGVDAVVAYYATLPPELHGVIPCPVQLHLAESDEFEPAADVAAFVSRLRDHGTPVAQHAYAGTEHSFANATVGTKLDQRAAALAFARAATFLEVQLDD